MMPSFWHSLRRVLSWRDLDIILGSIVMLMLLALIISTVGMKGEYSGHPKHTDLPPSGKIMSALLDRRPVEASTDDEDGGRDYLPDTRSDRSVNLPGRRPETHFLGTDSRGRDIVDGIRLGSRTILLPGVLAALLSIVLGTVLAVTEELGSRRELRRICEMTRTVVGSFPKFLILLVILSVGMDQNVGMLVFALCVGILGSIRVAEVVRAQILVLRQSDFIEACREMGLSNRQIALRHIVNGVSRGLLWGQFIYGIAEAILLEAMMAAVGYKLAGFDQATWANMVTGEFYRIKGEYILWSSVPPAIAIVVLILGLHLLASGLTRRLHFARLES
jgi:peptide/nickel transport system permease protein